MLRDATMVIRIPKGQKKKIAYEMTKTNQPKQESNQCDNRKIQYS